MVTISFTTDWGIGKFPFHPDTRVCRTIHDNNTVCVLYREQVCYCSLGRESNDLNPKTK
jgi:hypothetical protein